MKKIGIISAFLLAITCVVVAERIEKKRTTYFTAYYFDGIGWSYISTDGWGYFDDQIFSAQASIRDYFGNNHLLYATQSTSTPVEFHP